MTSPLFPLVQHRSNGNPDDDAQQVQKVKDAIKQDPKSLPNDLSDLFDDEGKNLLHLAASSNNTAMVDFVIYQLRLDKYGEPTESESNFRTKLDKLVESKDADQQLTPLIVAIQSGSLTTAQHLIEKYNANVSALNEFGRNALHIASRENHIHIINYLLSRPIGRDNIDFKQRINEKDDYCDTPLSIAVFFGYFDLVKLLIETYNADTSVLEENERTLLHLACCEGHFNLIDYLLCEAGFKTKLEALDAVGYTPLFLSVFTGQIGVVRHLITKYKADVTAFDDGNLLHIAALGGQLEMVDYLMTDCVVDCEQRNIVNENNNNNENTCPVIAVDDFKSQPLNENNKNDNNAGTCPVGDFKSQLECKDTRGLTPLAVCLVYNDIALANHLIDKYKANLTTFDSNGHTHLHRVCFHGSFEAIDFLITKCGFKSQLDTLVDAKGNLLLSFLVQSGQSKIATYLITKQNATATPTMLDGNTGRSLLHLACEDNTAIDFINVLMTKCTGFKDVIETPDKFGSTPLAIAIQSYAIDVVKLLITVYKAKTDTTSSMYNRNLLHIACENPRRVKHQIQQQALAQPPHTDNIQSQHPRNNTTNHNNNENVDPMIPILDFLINMSSLKPKLGEKTTQGYTPIAVAVRCGCVDLIRYLDRKYHVDTTILDNSGRNLLHLACLGGEIQSIEYLIDWLGFKTQIESKDAQGLTPLAIALCYKQNDAAIYLIEKHKADPNAVKHLGEDPLANPATNGNDK